MILVSFPVYTRLHEERGSLGLLNLDLIRDRRSQIARLVLLLCAAYFALAFVAQAWKARNLNQVLVQERAKLEQQEARNRELQEQLEMLSGKEYSVYVERVAREKLGMVKPGDIPVFVVPNPQAPKRQQKVLTAGEEQTGTNRQSDISVWRQWISVLLK